MLVEKRWTNSKMYRY